MYNFYIIFGFFLTINFQHVVGLGSPCTVQKTGQQGECINIYQCPPVMEQLRKNKKDLPTICDYSKKIVCCPITPKERISVLKCKEYGKYVYENITVPSLFIDEPEMIRSVDKCAHDTNQLIVGGEKAGDREFPHMALIGYAADWGISFGCAGSLISERYVLSAAHCAKTRSGPPKYAKLGTNHREYNGPETTLKRIVSVKAHEKYNPSENYFDIAILKLDSNVKFSTSIIPICLPQSEVTFSKIVATGFGLTGFGGTASNDLLKVTLDGLTTKECNDAFSHNSRVKQGIDGNSMICAGSKDPSREKDTCNGDSGGPLQILNHDVYCMYTVVGITSFGHAYCGHLGVYTKVLHYVDWIEKIVWNT